MNIGRDIALLAMTAIALCIAVHFAIRLVAQGFNGEYLLITIISVAMAVLFAWTLNVLNKKNRTSDGK